MHEHFSELQARASMLQPLAIARAHASERRTREVTQAELDAVLEASFPASDPPSWTAAVFRPSPEAETPMRQVDGAVPRMLRRVAALF